ncbi:hypothetical protein ALO77_04868 [Pseudomonas coronafaciens pv. garcae]|nr:hypothetical protein ALO77_04868 [Pseudomonas coronafaciens pv. garcae]
MGRFKVRGLMRELGLISKQPGSHAYKKATVERPDIPNILNREFDAPAPNQVWCGDITYIWAQGCWCLCDFDPGCRNSLTYSNTQRTKSLRGISYAAYRSVKISNLGQNRISANSTVLFGHQTPASILA